MDLDKYSNEQFISLLNQLSNGVTVYVKDQNCVNKVNEIKPTLNAKLVEV